MLGIFNLFACSLVAPFVIVTSNCGQVFLNAHHNAFLQHRPCHASRIVSSLDAYV